MKKGKVLSLLLVTLAFSSISCRNGQSPNHSGSSDVSLETYNAQKVWSPEQGYGHLLETKSFAFGGVGFAGVTSEGEFAFRAVLKSSDAANLFTNACSKATDEGKLYALCGLRATDRSAFNHYVADFRKKDEKVMTMSGCLMNQEPIKAVVQRIANGDYDSYFAKQ